VTATVTAGLACAAALVALVPRVAEASTVTRLDGDALAIGAERVVVAEVVALHSRWAADRRGLETVIELSPDEPGPPLTLVQPGGELDGARHVIVGMPAFQVGERARFYLRRNLDGTTWRVYGWSQGKWPEVRDGGAVRYLPPERATDDVIAFTTNGMVWPAAAMPVPYLLHTAGSDDLPFADVQTTVAAAFAVWEDVPCASLRFTAAGLTDLDVAVDGQNVVSFIESGWIYGAEAAGATSLWIVDGQQTADVAMNGQHFRWALGPPGSAITAGTLDLQAVLTHELGHFSGLGHSPSSHDTMYAAWTPWMGQRRLSLDDKLGVCALYATAGAECTATTGCLRGETCATTAAGPLCDAPADPVGQACNYDRIECEDFCLFTSADLSSGYCSRYCEDDRDCPLTHHCDEASAGSSTVKVCFAGAQPPPPPDAAAECTIDDDCPAATHCNTMNACSFDCRTDADCTGASGCDDRGRCTPAIGGSDPGGCGCRSSSDPRPSALALALLVTALAFALRRRRRRPEALRG
jgi:MYXO-CTERM domain-containing protein